MNGDGQLGGPAVYLVPLIALAMLILRNARARRLRVELMWISPAVILVATGWMLALQPPPGPGLLALDLVALALGALAGWWRGRLTRISVDPQTHRLTSRASPLGMLLILAIFAARYALRFQSPGALHVSTTQLTDMLLLLAVGLVCAQRLEMALRATRLLRQARADRARSAQP